MDVGGSENSAQAVEKPRPMVLEVALGQGTESLDLTFLGSPGAPVVCLLPFYHGK